MSTIEFNPQTTAHVIIDMSRSFGVASDEYPANHGYGELPVSGVHEIVPVVNRIIRRFDQDRGNAYTTQDWHPHSTAHFDRDGGPWAVHSVAGTPGAELHPGLALTAANHRRFIKGMKHLSLGEPDDSYTAVKAINPYTSETLPVQLQQAGMLAVILTGVALGDVADNKTCVDHSALDFKQRGFDTYVVADGVAALFDKQQALDRLASFGIKIVQADDIILELGSVQS